MVEQRKRLHRVSAIRSGTSHLQDFGVRRADRDEIVVTAQLANTGKGDPDGPLVLTTLKDAAGSGRS